MSKWRGSDEYNHCPNFAGGTRRWQVDAGDRYPAVLFAWKMTFQRCVSGHGIVQICRTLMAKSLSNFGGTRPRQVDAERSALAFFFLAWKMIFQRCGFGHGNPAQLAFRHSDNAVSGRVDTAGRVSSTPGSTLQSPDPDPKQRRLRAWVPGHGGDVDAGGK
jgi:hypothetical protein